MKVPNNNRLWKYERIMLVCGGLLIPLYIVYSGDFSALFSRGTDIPQLLVNLVSVGIFLGLTAVPYYFFYGMARRIHLSGGPSMYSRASFITTVMVMLSAFALYYWSAGTIRNSTSSTAAVIYVVLPIYIGIGGGIIYRVLLFFAKRRK